LILTDSNALIPQDLRDLGFLDKDEKLINYSNGADCSKLDKHKNPGQTRMRALNAVDEHFKLGILTNKGLMIVPTMF
jgi:hypothetical protein